VRSQTACEVYTQLALDRIAEHEAEQGQRRFDLFRAVTLRSKENRVRLRELTGAQIGDEKWWSAYSLHLDWRNEIVHLGISVSRQHTRDSLTAARSFIAFLRARWIRRRENPYRPAPGHQ
jgi:hypothetical protein